MVVIFVRGGLGTVLLLWQVGFYLLGFSDIGSKLGKFFPGLRLLFVGYAAVLVGQVAKCSLNRCLRGCRAVMVVSVSAARALVLLWLAVHVPAAPTGQAWSVGLV